MLRSSLNFDDVVYFYNRPARPQSSYASLRYTLSVLRSICIRVSPRNFFFAPLTFGWQSERRYLSTYTLLCGRGPVKKEEPERRKPCVGWVMSPRGDSVHTAMLTERHDWVCLFLFLLFLSIFAFIPFGSQSSIFSPLSERTTQYTTHSYLRNVGARNISGSRRVWVWKSQN